MMVMQFKVGQLVRAHHGMIDPASEAVVQRGDLGLVAETLHKTTVHGSFQTYRINWLPKAAIGVWWHRDEALLPFDGTDNAV